MGSTAAGGATKGKSGCRNIENGPGSLLNIRLQQLLNPAQVLGPITPERVSIFCTLVDSTIRAVLVTRK